MAGLVGPLTVIGKSCKNIRVGLHLLIHSSRATVFLNKVPSYFNSQFAQSWRKITPPLSGLASKNTYASQANNVREGEAIAERERERKIIRERSE